MISIPNFITLLRVPLAFAFLQENATYRLVALLLAILSDGLDGFIARRFNSITRVGTFLDPVADKFFVSFVLVILLQENRLQLWEACTMLCRDFSVLLFGIYLTFKKNLIQYQFRAILCGKAMTALQFAVLTALLIGLSIPRHVFLLFIVIGLMALGELYRDRKRIRIEG